MWFLFLPLLFVAVVLRINLLNVVQKSKALNIKRMPKYKQLWSDRE